MILEDKDILAVLLFGSRARGDADAMSDDDICIFVTDLKVGEGFARKKAHWATRLKVRPEAISVYTRSSAIQMAELGSLFLWHLKLEGRILQEKDAFAQKLFGALKPFSRHKVELDEYAELLGDVSQSLQLRGLLNEIDLHVLQVIVRNVCILLTHRVGLVSFGRLSSYLGARQSFSNLPVSEGCFEELCHWHLVYTRGMSTDRELPGPARAAELLKGAGDLIIFARGEFK